MKLTQTTGDLFAKYNALTPADDRNAKTNGDQAYWLGELTPRATGTMLEAIERRALPSKAAPTSCCGCCAPSRRARAGCRTSSRPPVAHKTGDFPPVLANDVGIVYATSRADRHLASS